MINEPRARKTYVVSFYDGKGQCRQEYFQNRREAEKAARKRGMAKGKASLTYWIDGAEMIRLARLGYAYDSSLERCRPSKRAAEFIREIDAMPKSKRESMFLDYRKFRTIDDVIEFHQRNRKAPRR